MFEFIKKIFRRKKQEVNLGKRNFLKIVGASVVGVAGLVGHRVFARFNDEDNSIVEQKSPGHHTIYANVISERNTGVGVTIDGVLFKDGEADSTNPTSHASRHEAGGADAMALITLQ